MAGGSWDIPPTFKRTFRQMTGRVGYPEAPSQRAHFRRNASLYAPVGANAEMPVISLPTMSDCTESVPS